MPALPKPYQAFQPAPKPDDAKTRALKEAALDLLAWSLQDISPSDHPSEQLHLKMGMEREGHFLPDVEAVARSMDYGENHKQLESRLDALEKNLHTAATQTYPDKMERVYREHSGTYLFEPVTLPLPPKEAATALRDASALLAKKGEEAGFTTRFGTVALPPNDEPYLSMMNGYEQETFATDHGDKIAGRSQHANVSLWYGGRNLFAIAPGSKGMAYHLDVARENKTLSAAIDESIAMLPGMTLPTRAGNYLKVAYGLSVQDFSAWGNTKESPAISVVRTNEPSESRIEFRQATADADPLDVALAAAIPITRSALKHAIRDDNDKIRLDANGSPQFETVPPPAHKTARELMPSRPEQAEELFNRPDNPNFTFLDELAAHKIEKIKASAVGESGKQAIRDAEKLRNIGTKLHSAYCQAYGLQSAMAPRAASFAIT